MNLVFSDEFSTPGRNFSQAAKDKRWIAMDYWYKATSDQEAYKPDAVTTRACNVSKNEICDSPGLLAITISNQVINDTYAPETWGPVAPPSPRPFKSGAINGWNKFCFTGGYLEIRMKMPGNPRIGGLWPGFWLLGNLGRPGFFNSSDYM